MAEGRGVTIYPDGGGVLLQSKKRVPAVARQPRCYGRRKPTLLKRRGCHYRPRCP